MNIGISAVTALVTLLGVALGGWLSLRNQDRSWHRDHARQWRDIRLSAYNEFLSAFRQYFAFALEPTAHISAVPHPRLPGEPMPFFDEIGRPYREKLDAAMMAVRLVSEIPGTLEALSEIVKHARRIAAARAEYDAQQIPSEFFQELWVAERSFVAAARMELGLSDIYKARTL